MRYIIPISGKDSLATAIVQREAYPQLPYEYFFNRVGSELPDTDQWLDQVERSLAITITRVGESLIDIMYLEGILPSRFARYCTRKAKIYPMFDYIGDDDALVYYGIRADENREGLHVASKHNIMTAYPLRDANMGINDVWRLLQDRQLMPPRYYWSLLETLTQYELTKPISAYNLPDWLHAYLFAWRSRMNCYHCFYQRPYEWIGLHAHYPDLFWRAVELEDTIGAQGFYFNSDGRSLRSMLDQAGAIIERRAKKIARIIEGLAKDDTDMLNVVSCGLLCGK